MIRYCDSHHNTGGFSGTDGNGTLITNNNFYDNALGLHDRRLHRARPPRLPAARQPDREQQLLLQQLQPLRRRLGRRAVHPGAGRHRPVARRRQRQRRPRQPLLRQLAPRDDAVRRPRRHGLRPRPATTPVPGCDPTQGLDVVRQPVPRQHDGRRPRRRGAAQRHGLLVGQLPRQHRQLLVGQHRGAGQDRHHVARRCCPSCANGTEPGSSVGTGDVAERGRAGRPAWRASRWPATPTATRTPAPGRSPRPSRAAAPGRGRERGRRPSRQTAQLAGICAEGLAPRLCAAFPGLASLTSRDAAQRPSRTRRADRSTVTPVASDGPLSLFTCSWWRKADAAHRLGHGPADPALRDDARRRRDAVRLRSGHARRPRHAAVQQPLQHGVRRARSRSTSCTAPRRRSPHSPPSNRAAKPGRTPPAPHGSSPPRTPPARGR